MSLREEYLAYMADLAPEIDDLPGDLSMVAASLEKKVPGLGACLAMHLADDLACSVYLRNYDELRTKRRNEWIMKMKDTYYPDGQRVTIRDISQAINLRERRVQSIIWEDKVESSQLKLWGG